MPTQEFLATECHGSLVVYINPEPSVIEVYVGESDQKGHCVVVTFHGILQLLQDLAYNYVRCSMHAIVCPFQLHTPISPMKMRIIHYSMLYFTCSR